MNSTTSPTGLYSGGLRWVDPPGAAAGSVKPRDRAGPGPLKARGGAPPLSPAVRGRLQPQQAADALGGSRRAGGGRGQLAGAWARPGAPGLSEPLPAGGARASAAREREGRRLPVLPAGRAGACGAGRVGRDGARRPGQSERAGAGQGGRRGRGGRDRLSRTGLGKTAGAGRPCRWSCAGQRCAGACRGINLEQLFVFYDPASEECCQMVRYTSGGGRVHDDH
jgi:hypothetical protein